MDIVLYDGEAHYCVVVDNGPTIEPYFNETWGLCPSKLPESQQAELRVRRTPHGPCCAAVLAPRNLALPLLTPVVSARTPSASDHSRPLCVACPSQEMGIAALKSCGFTQGIFHVELKYTSRGPRLIEINARMGGGQVRETHRRVYGVDLVEETLFACVGIPCRPNKAEPALCHLAYNYVNAHRSGRVTDISAVRKLDARDDVVYAKPLVKEGDIIVGPEEGMPTWVADIMVSKQEAEQALEYVLSLSESLTVGVEPVKASLELPK